MYRSGLVPRGMALLGLVAGPVLCAGGIAVLFGVIEPDSALKALAAAPEFVWELSLGIYLMVKGFKSSGVARLQPIAGRSQPATRFQPPSRLVANLEGGPGRPPGPAFIQGSPATPTIQDRIGGIELINRHPEGASIGRYRHVPVEVHGADPATPEVARRLIALIATRWPGPPAEHVGSSAVPGLAGKNIIDLLLAAEPAHMPASTEALLELGLRYQVPAVFPATRPMLWGAFRHGVTEYRVHVHVVPAGSPEVAALRGFRDALRADRRLCRRYAALKRAIVEGGPVDPVTFTKAKHDWIVAALARLGLAGHQPRRLYQDDLGSPDRLAS